MTTLQEIIDEMTHQLDWRSPNGKMLGHIVLSRSDAALLVREVCELLLRPKTPEEEMSP